MNLVKKKKSRNRQYAPNLYKNFSVEKKDKGHKYARQ